MNQAEIHLGLINLGKIDGTTVNREARWLRDTGHSFQALLLEALWMQLCLAHPPPPPEVTPELGAFDTAIPGYPCLSLAFLRSILTEIEPPDRGLYMSIDDGVNRRRALRMCSLGHLQQLCQLAMHVAAGVALADSARGASTQTTSACDTLSGGENALRGLRSSDIPTEATGEARAAEVDC